MVAISVIGIGNMGKAIGAIAARGGASVQYVGRDGEKAAEIAAESGASASVIGESLTGDIVVLAVPYDAVAELAAVYGSAFDGKIVVDITNPVDGATFDGLVVPADASAAAELADTIPGARIVKAFNTNFASTLVAGSIGDSTTTVLVAGDDVAAKAEVMAFVRAGGVNAEDSGSLKRARELESIGFLQIKLAAAEKIAWTGGFALTK